MRNILIFRIFSIFRILVFRIQPFGLLVEVEHDGTGDQALRIREKNVPHDVIYGVIYDVIYVIYDVIYVIHDVITI